MDESQLWGTMDLRLRFPCYSSWIQRFWVNEHHLILNGVENVRLRVCHDSVDDLIPHVSLIKISLPDLQKVDLRRSSGLLA